MGRSSDSGVHELPGGRVSRGSIAGDSVSIIFALASPNTVPAFTAEQRTVRVQPQADISPDSTRGGPLTPDERGPVYRISGAGYANVMGVSPFMGKQISTTLSVRIATSSARNSGNL